MKNTIYRAELDGLRTLAVLSVLIYHAELTVFDFTIFQGGFFGVDVFFVLSGFLITSIIKNDLEIGRFSFGDFYWRRIKRIVPVYFFVILITLAAAYVIYVPEEWSSLINGVRSASIFVSNNYFMNQNDYFSNNLHETLLHTWSLSVEWQFYLFFPLVMFITYRVFPRYVLSLLLIILFFSFCLSYASSLLGYTNFAFYSLMPRAWELLAGGVIAYFNREKLISSTPRSVQQLLMALAMFLMIFSMLFINHEVQHLGFITLLPVIGTCIFITFAKSGELITDIFKLKPIVFIGTLSYSIYLWHQPLYVFYRKLNNDQIELVGFISLLITTMFLAYLSYRIIEVPFRNKINKKKSIIVLLVFMFLIQIISRYLPSMTSVIPYEDSNYGHRGVCTGEKANNIKWTCSYNNDYKYEDNMLLLGDSHAGMYSKYLVDFYENKNVNWVHLSYGGIYPFRNFVPTKAKNRHVKVKAMEDIRDYLDEKDLTNTTVMYSQFMTVELKKKNGILLSDKKNMIIEDLQNLQSKVKKLILIYHHPTYKEHVSLKVTKEIRLSITESIKSDNYLSQEIKINYQDFKRRHKLSYEILDAVIGENIVRIYPEDMLCDEKYCYAKRKGEGMDVFDLHHLSIKGAGKVFSVIKNHLPQ